MIKCAECGREISDTAAACPGCGAPARKKKRSSDGIGWVILVIGAGAIVYSCVASNDSNSNSSSAKPVSPGESARGACSLFVERAAHDPSSVSFVDYERWSISQQSADTWVVVADYRAKNRLGALQLSRVACTVRRSGNDWSLVSLTK